MARRACAEPLDSPYAKRAVPLPDELLRLIFLRTVPPSMFLDTSFSRSRSSAYSSAVTTKRSIVFTCKQWARVGTELLYATILISHIGQLLALARTLAARPALGRLVRVLEIRCVVFQGHVPLYTRELGAVFAALPRLANVVHCPLLPGWEMSTDDDWVALDKGTSPAVRLEVVTRSLDVLPRTLRCLVLGMGECLGPFENIVGEFAALEELDISLYMLSTFPQTVHKSIKLSHLTVLRISIYHSSFALLDRISQIWSMPALTNIRLDFNFYHVPTSHLDTFLLSHGRAITYLHIRCGGGVGLLPNVAFAAQLHILPHACPDLTHLVLCAGVILPNIPHMTVRYVDTWMSDLAAHRDVDAKSREDLLRIFPRLQRMRALDCALPDVSDWPRLFPPYDSLTPGNEGVEYAFLGLHVRVTESAIQRIDLCDWAVDLDDDSGTDYDSQSSSDTESIELWSDGEGRWDDPEEEFGGTTVPAEMEELLEIWDYMRDAPEDGDTEDGDCQEADILL
ncbi:hypothetical protein FIBSPDRAFT_1036413 [Athelia psychrophila]|uniref:F-box domain-containing protein n=1 Tax=Athelia psychrophila TaxID=1759441 RepID=A0A166W2N8_9AGAM|nr:hypothetical protein FIBSPDRAFT_1036413 [Fibularhizoctonia sp. CBS 109695]